MSWWSTSSDAEEAACTLEDDACMLDDDDEDDDDEDEEASAACSWAVAAMKGKSREVVRKGLWLESILAPHWTRSPRLDGRPGVFEGINLTQDTPNACSWQFHGGSGILDKLCWSSSRMSIYGNVATPRICNFGVSNWRNILSCLLSISAINVLATHRIFSFFVLWLYLSPSIQTIVK